MQYETINPATEEVIDRYETMPCRQVLEIAARSQEAQRAWRQMDIAERAPYLIRLAAALRDDLDRYAGLITLEMGKTITESKAEVEKCAWLCEVYAERGASWLEEEQVEAGGEQHLVVFEPLGVVLSIMPWNYPFWQALRFGVPTVLAGNASILKHASNVPQCGFAIEEAFQKAGFPENLFRHVLADHGTVAELMASDTIAGVSLTGSTGAGARIAEAAGRCLKKVVLELGGSDPFIVLEDADIDFAAQGAVQGRLITTGQSCVAAKRFIVVEPVAEAFAARFAELMGAMTIGDPMNATTQVGPMVNQDGIAEVEEQLAQSVGLGGKVLTGGRRLDRPGYFFAPTVVTHTTPEMRIVKEEVFGPVAPVIVVADEEEAIRVANDTEFGLGSSIWTRDLERGVRLGRRIDAGIVFVNSIVKSDPRMPFGGVKKSGIGRELSKYGLREFVNVKGINVFAHGG